jgi:exodeoxyribonuclease VIII
MAFYRRGLGLGPATSDAACALIAIEKTPPYAVAVYDMVPDELDMVDAHVQKLLETWAECKRTGVYPGYNTLSQPLMLPDWALGDKEDVIVTFDGEAMF